MVGWRPVVMAVVVGALFLSCSGDDDDDDEAVPLTPEPTNCGDEVAEPELREELLAMMEADQAERTGELPAVSNDQARTDRLREIVDEHGWPTCDLVGEEANSAAWVIAQHADQDVEFQQRALELMREAVADGVADATELAYLEDRVAVNTDRPQRYGTQVHCVDGHAEPQDLEDPDTVDERRAEVGMEPAALDDYLADFEAGCLGS